MIGGICPRCGAEIAEIDYDEEDKHELMSSTLDHAIEVFEKQFGVELEPTGYELDDEDQLSREYWVRGWELEIGSNVIEVGGWFDVDEEGNVSCLLGITFNGENMLGDKALMSWFNAERDEWEDIVLDQL